MANFRMILAGFAVALAMTMSAAFAAPLSAPGVAPVAANDLVIKVHGWHGNCAMGRAGVHRHVPGAGRVPCRGYNRPPIYRAPPVYAPPPNPCAGVYNACYARYGRGSPAYFRCMRRGGCG